MAVFQLIESWYNAMHRHSTVGYRSPNDFERTTAVARGASRERR